MGVWEESAEVELKCDKVRGIKKNILLQQLHNLFSSPANVMVFNSRIIIWYGKPTNVHKF
jgi:hypothetical protein